MRALGVHRRIGATDDGRTEAAEEITFFTGCCFLARATLLGRTGGFDDSFFAYVEDAELSLRLRRAGHTLLYVPSARAFHRIAEDTPTTPFHIRQRDRNRRRLVARHYGLLDRLRFAAWFYPTRLVHTVRYVMSGNLENARAQLEGAFGGLDGAQTGRQAGVSVD
jgi:GT2 family glycosyltransferase